MASSGEERTLLTSGVKDEQAEALDKRISQHTWDAVCKKIEEKNKLLGKTDLRKIVENRWIEWKKYLNKKRNERNKLMENMLYPKCEGEEILGSLRVGLKTVNILADGLKMLLIVSVALDRNNNKWNSSTDNIRVLALEYWSGLAGKCKVDYLADMAGDILRKEPASILLLSKVTDSPHEIYEDMPLHGLNPPSKLGKQRDPKLLVTNNIRFRKLIKTRDIDEIHKYLKKGQKFDNSYQEKILKKMARL